ncbi:MAG: thioredoxin family protein [Elusimicrobia bacterium]|nr:thioredoxin family protein [Elusimicrobiota bacterium]
MPTFTAAPDFSLKGTDGKTYSLDSFRDAKALVVVFSCNHCPYVKAYEDRMVRIQGDYLAKGVRLAVINSNDDVGYPEDSFDEMVRRAEEKRFNFPYLRDDSQKVAKAYGATHTPHLFVFGPDRRLAYTGKIDDNWENPSAVKKQFLRDSLEAILAGKNPDPAETFAIGCTIKWKR